MRSACGVLLLAGLALGCGNTSRNSTDPAQGGSGGSAPTVGGTTGVGGNAGNAGGGAASGGAAAGGVGTTGGSGQGGGAGVSEAGGGGTSGSAGAAGAAGQPCNGLLPICGPEGQSDCCATSVVPG